MPGVPQTLPVPPLVNEMTMLNAIRLAAGAGGGGGGGATGDVVGPASSTDGAVVLWDGLTGKLLKDSSIFITGGGTVALGGFTLTVPATGTAALLGVAQTFTAANIFSVNGAASTPAMSLTGTIFTGGTATTTKPHYLIEPAGTTSTGWNTAGTLLGVNAPSGFGGNIADLQVAGVKKFAINSVGDVYTRNGIIQAEFTLTFQSYATNFLQCDPSYGVYIPQASGISVGDASGFFGFYNGGTGQNNARLYGGGTGQVEQRKDAIAQTFRVYETYTDASNYARLAFETTAGAYSIKPEAAGTGTLRDLHISGLPTSNPGPGILWNNAGTPAIGT